MSVGWAQWRSSITTTSGCRRAIASSTRRNAQDVSSGEPASSASVEGAGDEALDERGVLVALEEDGQRQTRPGRGSRRAPSR